MVTEQRNSRPPRTHFEVLKTLAGAECSYFLNLAAGAAALPVLPCVAWADTYPSRPVRMIVGFPAGNASDIIARLTAQSLSDRLGQKFVVENRPGAGSSIGTEVVVKAQPDGFTLLI
jgi:tripartite-type tricarboxylate transporter receptor subunit TctC